MSDSPRHVVVLVIDRLNIGYLGPYGNAWLPTPAFNRLACESLVLDRVVADSPAVLDTYQSYWTGVPSYVDRVKWEAGHGEYAGLIAECAAQNVHAELLTDSDLIAGHPLAEQFTTCELLSFESEAAMDNAVPAADIEETELAQFYAAVQEHLGKPLDNSTSRLLWVHTESLARIWDAPLELRNQFAAEDDPLPPELVVPPALRVDDSTDPDLLLGLRHAYAGQIAVLDWCLEHFLSALREHEQWRDALLIVTSPRGYPLGEHGVFGSISDPLYGELIHLPLLIRRPGTGQLADRSQALVQPADLAATIRDWFGWQPHTWQTDSSLAGGSILNQSVSRGTPTRRCLFTCGGKHATALTTPGWFLRIERDAAERERQSHQPERHLDLYVKPDDYFEVNEVASRCFDAAEDLAAIARSIESAAATGELLEPELPDSLVHGMTNQVQGTVRE
ncbi:MAG: sulfatase-like hydrolase/transferase [Planctomycetota bacterium]|nr:sulfatase-like hydrolase/transferase [Planctomycetota bacterium]